MAGCALEHAALKVKLRGKMQLTSNEQSLVVIVIAIVMYVCIYTYTYTYIYIYIYTYVLYIYIYIYGTIPVKDHWARDGPLETTTEQ